MSNDTQQPKILAWHFVKDSRTLRDGRPLPAVGEVLRHDGPLIPCVAGLHASTRVYDALKYAEGAVLCRVECGGEMAYHGNPVDKLACRERTILAAVDAAPMLHEFACWCAEQALARVNNPDPRSLNAIKVKRAWLRGEATDAELDAARSAAWSAAESAAWSAARSAARSAAWSAAESAAWSAAWSAAESAQAAELESRALALVAASGNR